MPVYMDIYGRLYSADSPAASADMIIVTPSPKLTAILQDQPVPVLATDMNEVFAREKNDPGFIMKFVTERKKVKDAEVPAIKV